ncbi:oxygen-independent coproporphyrinogen III oxidase [Rhizobium sp. KVB221]|uniref:Coproporphyrinogen-III oxidase n=1 Tax=Rhizobium setariae TaxID=2801340 RepID=A0A937CQM4_9HYPH|nr:oxygen-independent coproporphyrinogen III oxidase [Rhizobium setariae]MBL0373207.1 oxygen-independent coproporphyrinogen III oxidase [Rhizobium setariae]
MTQLIEKYAGNVPRYTSYPTAPHYHAGIGNNEYIRWLGDLNETDRLSLYLHIPYCDRLCWFCACHTKQTRQYAPVRAYLAALEAEIRTVGRHVSRSAKVTAIHLGGGSPTLLEADDVIQLHRTLAQNFDFADEVEISVEMDPNDMDASRYDALAAIGMSRASLGVQDFDPRVQQTINRIQTFEQTKSVVDEVRLRGVRSVNCDIVYGLPHQTMDSLVRTVEHIVSLAPDRIALFGYAHVPWMKKHQTMIDDSTLPDAAMRFELMTVASRMLVDTGYLAIGIDHFALPGDSLAIAANNGHLKRNFQGYTDDEATTIIGLGASSIGSFRQGYIQNIPATGQYEKKVLSGELAAVRGIEVDDTDRMRRWVIERIMCDFSFSFRELGHEFGIGASTILAECQALCTDDQLISIKGDRFEIAPEARPFARSIAAKFDAYLASGAGRHSMAV